MEERGFEDSWEFRADDAAAERRNLRFLTDTAADLYADLAYNDRLKRILDRAITLTGAEMGLAFLEQRGDLERCCARDANGQDLLPWPENYSRRIVRDVWRTGEEQHHGGFPREAVGAHTITDVNMGSVSAVRLAFGDRPVGVLYTQASFRGWQMSPAEIETFRTLAGLLATAIRNEHLQDAAERLAHLEDQIADARKVQARLRPGIHVSPEGLELFGAARVCENLSGDYYDVIPRPDGRSVLAIGDVRHHGIHAAVHMTTARALLRQLMEEDREPAEALQIISRHFAGVMEVGDFMSLFVAVYDPADASLVWASAGHNPPLLRQADGTVLELEKTGTALRLIPDGSYEMKGPVSLHAGDALLLYTDGIVEAMRGPQEKREMYGEERLKATLDRLMREGRDLQRITAGLLADMDRFRNPGPPEDDVTLLVVRRPD